MSREMILASYGIVVIGSVSATAFFMILMLFFKSSSASGAFFGMLSAAAGFVIGAYMPIGQFAEEIQTFCNLIPASHATILMRGALLNGVLDHINEGIGGLDSGMFVDSIKKEFTFNASLFGEKMSNNQSVWYILAIMVVCIIVMIVAYNKTYKRK